jgi:hypothetical protein
MQAKYDYNAFRQDLPRIGEFKLRFMGWLVKDQHGA